MSTLTCESGPKMKLRSFIRTTSQLVATTLVLTLALSPFAAPKAEAITPKTALVYGDSITWESRYATANQFKLKKGWTYINKSYPGTAPCDWLVNLQTDLATYQPSIVAIETEGNNTRPCMLDGNGNVMPKTSEEYFSKYTSDLSAFFAQVTASGARLLFVKGIPMKDTTWNAAVTRLNTIGVALAGQYHGVSVTASPRNAVSASGKYVDYKKCLANEVSAGYCGVDGKIVIRTQIGSQTGIHLCVSGLNAGYPYNCPDAYSSGEYRFGKTLTNVIVSPPAPVLP